MKLQPSELVNFAVIKIVFQNAAMLLISVNIIFTLRKLFLTGALNLENNEKLYLIRMLLEVLMR